MLRLNHVFRGRPAAKQQQQLQQLLRFRTCASSARRTRQSGRRVQRQDFDTFKGLVSQLTKGSPQQQQQRNATGHGLGTDDDGAELVRIDTASRGGLGGTTDSVFGPLAVLLVGFMPEEFEAFRAMLADMEAHMVKVVPCTKALLTGTLQEALEAECPQYEQPPLDQRRALFLSGMYGSEVVELITAYREAGLPPCAFAAAVPNSWQRNVKELSEAVWRDQAAMMAKQQASSGLEDTWQSG